MAEGNVSEFEDKSNVKKEEKQMIIEARKQYNRKLVNICATGVPERKEEENWAKQNLKKKMMNGFPAEVKTTK